MTIEKHYAKLKNEHLIGLLPKHAYLYFTLRGMAYQEQMERELAELGSAANARVAAKPPQSVQDEAKANGAGVTADRAEIVALEAKSEAGA